jgi:hypothetical protein
VFFARVDYLSPSLSLSLSLSLALFFFFFFFFFSKGLFSLDFLSSSAEGKSLSRHVINPKFKKP